MAACRWATASLSTPTCSASAHATRRITSTGVFLAMYYDPSPTQAYGSVRHIINDVFLGEFVRGMHKWGASVMVVLVFLHMGRVFFFGAYKYPRELNWVIGVVLLILTMVMGLTGYLLPFDQRSYWATIVAMNITANGPLLGPYLADFLRAGAELGPKADPTTTTYVPRPEWYFFFLFELLRVIKPPELVPLAVIGIPTICMILIIMLPFYDRSPERRPERRPIAM